MVTMLHRALKLLRSYHRLTQQQLADRLEISNSYLSEIEKGSKTASMELLGKYATVFSIPVSSILLFSERIDADKPSDRIRFSASQKILKLLEWIDEGEAVGRGA